MSWVNGKIPVIAVLRKKKSIFKNGYLFTFLTNFMHDARNFKVFKLI